MSGKNVEEGMEQEKTCDQGKEEEEEEGRRAEQGKE
jgi:hypothetical protein